MYGSNKFIMIAIVSTSLMLFAPVGEAEEPGPRRGLTFSYYTGGAELQDVEGFNTPTTYGYQLGLQGRILGLTYGQTKLGGFTTLGGIATNVDVESREVLLSLRTSSYGASLFFYYGLADWQLTSSSQWTQNAASGTSPVVGIGIKLGNSLGLLLTAMQYRDLTDSDILAINAGINF